MCNLRPDRAPHIGRFCFPLCWRCTACIAAFTCLGFLGHMLPFWVGLLLILPCAIDGIWQYRFGHESTNFRRVVTGAMLGIAIAVLTHHLDSFLKQ